MEPSDQDVLQKTLKLSEENNRLLKGIQRRFRLMTTFTVVRWVIVALIALGAFYYIQPYLEKVIQIYGKINDTSGLIQQGRDSFQNNWASFKDLFTNPGGDPATTTQE
jgi:hypothetical protein